MIDTFENFHVRQQGECFSGSIVRKLLDFIQKISTIELQNNGKSSS